MTFIRSSKNCRAQQVRPRSPETGLQGLQCWELALGTPHLWGIHFQSLHVLSAKPLRSRPASEDAKSWWVIKVHLQMLRVPSFCVRFVATGFRANPVSSSGREYGAICITRGGNFLLERISGIDVIVFSFLFFFLFVNMSLLNKIHE